MDIKDLSDALHYCNVKELELICKQYGLSTNIPAPLLKKPSLIQAIITYVQTGQKMVVAIKLPAVSCAIKSTDLSVLTSDTAILFGSYKNDLRTRLFMQKLIGKHFHFTVYGHDWIKERWMLGNPPTYQEFADFWQQEYLLRKEHKESSLKKEWAYLNFMRDYRAQHPDADKHEALMVWQKVRTEKVEYALACLKKIL